MLSKTELEMLNDEKLMDEFVKTIVMNTKQEGGGNEELIAQENLITEILMGRISEPQQLINLCAYAAPLTKEEYPDLQYLPEERHRRHLVGHSLRHLSSSTGQMQKLVEHAEHGELFDEKAVRQLIASAMFTICKLCEVMDIKGRSLVWMVRGVANSLLGERAQAEQFTNA